MEFDLENPLLNNDDSITDLFNGESDHMSSFAGNADQSSRQNAVSLILQITCNFDPFLTYLAVNYVDRFLSKREIPSGKPWVLRLLSIACLSLASKMKKINFSLTDFIFDAQTIKRMEMLVLDTLEWRMRSITPFCFINYFMSFFMPDQPPLLEALKNRALEMIFKTQNDIKILDFKPSTIAASALLFAADELFPVQLLSFQCAISSSQFVNEERLSACMCLMSEMMAMDGCDSAYEMISSSDTPVSVLHEAQSNLSDGPDLKKRRTVAVLFGLKKKGN